MAIFPQAGFQGAEPARKKSRQKKVFPTDSPADSSNIPESDCLFRPDQALTFAQGECSLLVIGGTGSGKTRSVLLPCLFNP